MKRVIVDYAKLTNEILTLLVERFPEGYDDSNIIRFKNAKNETIEAVEVRTEDTIYLVKVSTKLADRIENFDEDDMDPTDDIDTLKDLDIADDEAEDEVEETEDRPDVDEEGEDGDDNDIEDTEYSDDEEDED
ncbi:hypothetical protein D3C87_128500 [compost metagenome]